MRRRQFTIALSCGILSPLAFPGHISAQAFSSVKTMNTSIPAWPYPHLIAHRGGGTLAPENTLAAMRAGHQFGYKMVEYDVKLSRELEPILMHDSTLDRTTNATGPASALSLAELTRLDAGSWHGNPYKGEPIPTLEQVARFTLANRIASNIEIKPTPGDEQRTGERVANEAARLWAGQAVSPLLSSFSLTSLAAARSAQPGLPMGWITSELNPGWESSIAGLGLVSIHLRHDKVTRELIKHVHRLGLCLAVWTVNDPAKAALLLDWGVDAIITDALNLIQPDLDKNSRV